MPARTAALPKQHDSPARLGCVPAATGSSPSRCGRQRHVNEQYPSEHREASRQRAIQYRSASTRARSPTRRPAPSSRRFTRPRPTCRRRWASTRATSTRARRTPRAARSKPTSPPSRAARRRSRLPPAWRRPSAVMTLLEAGDHVVVTDNTYGGTYRLFERVLRKYQLDFTYVDTSRSRGDRGGVRARRRRCCSSRRRPTRCCDSPTSRPPASIAHGTASRWSWTTRSPAPYVQRPIDLGADLVVHSTTKFLNGHSDSVGGVVIAMRDDHIEWLKFIQNAEGAILGPMDAWLVLRGTKTLPLRMERHNANAQALAEYLAAHPKVTRVHYPGSARPSAARAGEAADARVRRHDLVRARLARARARRCSTASS